MSFVGVVLEGAQRGERKEGDGKLGKWRGEGKGAGGVMTGWRMRGVRGCNEGVKEGGRKGTAC